MVQVIYFCPETFIILRKLYDAEDVNKPRPRKEMKAQQELSADGHTECFSSFYNIFHPLYLHDKKTYANVASDTKTQEYYENNSKQNEMEDVSTNYDKWVVHQKRHHETEGASRRREEETRCWWVSHFRTLCTKENRSLIQTDQTYQAPLDLKCIFVPWVSKCCTSLFKKKKCYCFDLMGRASWTGWRSSSGCSCMSLRADIQNGPRGEASSTSVVTVYKSLQSNVIHADVSLTDSFIILSLCFFWPETDFGENKSESWL